MLLLAGRNGFDALGAGFWFGKIEGAIGGLKFWKENGTEFALPNGWVPPKKNGVFVDEVATDVDTGGGLKVNG